MRFYKGKIPVLFRGDSTLMDEKPGIKKIIRRVLLKFVYNYIDMALYAGVANKAYFKAHGIMEKELLFMPHAIDNKRFADNLEKKNQVIIFRKQLGIPDNALVFLFAGKLESKKQPDFLAKAFLALNNPDIFLIIAGSGALDNSLKREYGAQQNIKFVGFQNQQQMPLLYSSCDVFVLPSQGPGETWGLSINEAMAAGKAIIASNACGATYDLVENNKNGFIFEKKNKNDLQKCLQYFVDDKNAAIKMGEYSLNKIQGYSYEKDCIALESILIKMKNVKYN